MTQVTCVPSPTCLATRLVARYRSDGLDNVTDIANRDKKAIVPVPLRHSALGYPSPRGRAETEASSQG